jgi:hypothetical protein
VVQLDGTGAATLEVTLAGRPAAFAKLFPDGSGAAVTAKLEALREHGFGPGSVHQAVEPLAFVPDVGLLLAAVAPGACVADAIGVDDAALAAGCAHAGRWIAQLHRSPLRLGRPLPLLLTAELIPLAHRLAKAAARHPDRLGPSLRMLEVLDALSRDAVEGRSVQCHGQYRPIHVFVTPETTTVIDLDRSAPGDPARDVAEFLHRLRTSAYSTTGSVAAAEEPGRAFLDAYREAAGGEEGLANLRLHRARFLVHSYNSQLKSHDPDAGRRDFCLAELDALLAEPA